MASAHDKHGPSDRRGHRHGRRHLARRRQGRQLGEADRRRIRHPPHHPLCRPTASRPRSPARSISCRSSRSARPTCRERMAATGRRGGDRRVRHRRARAISRARCSWRCRRSRSNGRIATSSRPRPAPTTTVGYDDLLRASASGRFHAYPRALPVRLGRRASRRPVRHQGLADFAVDRLRLGRERDPARRRGDPPRRSRRRALHRHRRLGQSGIADPLLAAVGALDLERSAGSGGQAVRQEPRRLRHGRGRRRAGARELRIRQGARRQDPRRARRLRRDGRLASTAPARAPTASRSSAASATRVADAGLTPDDIDYINPHGTGTPENDKMEYLGVTAVFGERAKIDPDLVEQVDDRPHAVGGRRGRGGVHAADAASTSACRRPSITTCRIRRSRSTSCRTWRATPRCATRISNSFGFGGQNVSLVMGREPA